jgi:hypothetical protein
MTSKRTRASNTIAKQSTEMAFAVPQVIAHRLTRMALAGPVLSSRDQKEFQDMVAEKQAAFMQAWTAMATESLRANQAMAMSMFGAFLNPFSRGKSSSKIASDMQTAAMGVFSKGLAPMHKKAVSNAKRLAKTKLR